MKLSIAHVGVSICANDPNSSRMLQWLWSTLGESSELFPRWLLSPTGPWMHQQVRIFFLKLQNKKRSQCHSHSLRYKPSPPLKEAAVSVFWSPDYVEMWIVMVSMVSGCLMYTVLVANTTAMIANVDPAAKEYKSKVLMGDTIYVPLQM